MANVYEQFLAPSETNQQPAVVPDNSVPIGASGEALNLPPNTGADNQYGGIPAPVTNAPKNVYAQFLESEPPQAQQDKPSVSASNPYAKFVQSPSTDTAIEPEQTGKAINLPAMPWYENLAKSTAAQTAASFIRQAEGFERAGAAPVTDLSRVNAPFQRAGTSEEVTSTFDKSISDQEALLSNLQSVADKKGFVSSDLKRQMDAAKQQIGNLQIQKQQTLERPEYSEQAQQELLQERQQMGQEATQLEQKAEGMFPYFGVNASDEAISAQIGRGLGTFAGLAPAMVTGPLALPIMATQGASQAYAEGYNEKEKELKKQGVTDQGEIDKEAHQAGSQAAVGSVPQLAAYMVGGALTTKATSALLKGSSPIVKGLVGGTAAAGVNLATSGGLRVAQGGSFAPTIEQSVPDILFGAIHGVGSFAQARAEAKAKIDASVGGPEPKVKPSANSTVNEREAQILAGADEQATVPEGVTTVEPTPVPADEAKAPATTPDLDTLISDLLFEKEGSLEYEAIQKQIDALKGGEPPTETEPTTPNAVQITSTEEAMLRPQVTGQGEVVELPRVGEQKPEVPAKEAEAPKEEVAPKYTPEVQAKLDELKNRVDEQRRMLKFYLDKKIIDNEGYQKRSKALGMTSAAEKRQITGELTAKEQAAKNKREASNYMGKPVSVDGRNGKVVGTTSFGRVPIRFEDGTELNVPREKIEAPIAQEPQPPVEAKPEEVKPEEVKFSLPEQTQNEFLDFAKKQGGLNKTQAQKALVEYEKAGNITIGETGEMLFTKLEHSTRESLRKAAGIKEAPTASKSQPIRDLLRRFQSGEEDSIDTLKGLADAVGDLARKTKNKRLAYLSSEMEKAVSLGAEIEDAQQLVDGSLVAIEDEANMIDSPKKGKQPTLQKKTKKDKAREVFGNAVESLSQVLESKILDPIQYKRMVKSGMIEGGGEYDFFYNHKFPKKVRELIFSKTGERIDVVSDNMGFKDPTELLTAIDDAYRSAERINEETKALEKQQADIEENLRKMAEMEKTDPEAHALAVEEEVRTHLRNQLRREGGYTELPQIIYDAAISVGRSVAKAARDFKSWSGEMVSRLGDGISNHLRKIWGSIKESWNKDIGGGFDTGGRSRESAMGEAERYGPKAPTEQEAFAKKAADAFLKGRGKPITEDEMASILARKFPGISPAEVSDLYATASGKPKPSTAYAGGVEDFTETPEQISIRRKDQADQVRQGILTSPVPAGEGTSRAEILDQGNANLSKGDDPFVALEKAKQGDFNALTTAKAYSQGLAKKVSDALKRFGPNSPEYKELAKQYQDYYEGIREAGTVASDILRTFQGQTDLSNAADIAREYTTITGEQPTLSQHEQIRKVADKVDRTIKESEKASNDHKTTMDEGLSEVEVQTPTSVEEGRQQVADLSDAQGKKAKDEIDRLNNELEQTKKDLEEAKKAKATGQDAESLKAYYEAKLKDLQGQLDKTPKYGKDVLDQAEKIVKRWELEAVEAEKELRKILSQQGTSPDPTAILPLAKIIKAWLGRRALTFAEASSEAIAKFGEKVRPHLKSAWEKAQELKSQDGGEKVAKIVRKATTKAKAKPINKMTPAEKAEESLRKRIAQTQKKIDDFNSGKITTPKEVEKVTSDEIKRLEDEYNQKKKELADARLKSKQKELFEKEKVGEDLNPEQVKTLWESAKRFYLDKGEGDYDKMIADIASDFGITPQQVRKAFGTPKGAKKASDEMYLKQRNRQMALDEAKRWLDNQKASWIGKVFGTAAEKTFKLAIFGHGTAFIGTHAPQVLYTNPKLAFKAWLKGLGYSFRGKDGRIKNIIDNKDLIYRPNWIVARRGGLENDPREIRREGATPARSDSTLAKALDTISGGRGFDALFHLRQDMFDQAWNQLSVTMRTPEMAEMLANSINNATGFTKGGRRTAGILQSPITKILFFAPKLIASRFKWLIQDPARMLNTFGKMANPFIKVSPEERMSAVYEAKNKAKFLGVMTGTLLANQALLSVTGSNQSINFLDPKKHDWLAYKGFGYNLATIGAFTRIIRLVAQEYHAVFGELSRWEKAKGGREQVMKDALYTYLRSGLSPITRDIIVAATGKDYVGNTAPWSNEQPDRGRRKLTWREIIQEQFAPIPISEAATQKEVIPAAVKAGSAAFLGTRLETPADVEEYEKSLKSKAKPSGELGGIRGLRGFGKGL